MNKRKVLGIALIVAIFLGLVATVVYVFTELKEETDINIQQIENTDAKKFKSEYESLNDQEVKEGLKYRSVNIDENNPIKYATASDIVNKIDNKESFLVYFGFDSCPWCRSIIESMLESAKNNNISTIYYVDVKSIRDVYTLNEKHEAVRTTEGTEGYYNLLTRLDNVLEDYAPLTYKETKKVRGKKTEVTTSVEINEKRIYAPNIVLVKEGKALLLTTAISEELTDPYMELTDEIKKYSLDEFDNIFKEMETTTTTTIPVCEGPSNC
jgi:thiol-disulfide isomerase/thioredoxin